MKKTVILAIVTSLALASAACVKAPNEVLGRAEQALVDAGHKVETLQVVRTAEGEICPGTSGFIVYRSDKGVGVICVNPETGYPLIQLSGINATPAV